MDKSLISKIIIIIYTLLLTYHEIDGVINGTDKTHSFNFQNTIQNIVNEQIKPKD